MKEKTQRRFLVNQLKFLSPKRIVAVAFGIWLFLSTILAPWVIATQPAQAFIGQTIVSVKFFTGDAMFKQYVLYDDSVVVPAESNSGDRRWELTCNGQKVVLSGNKVLEAISLLDSISVDATICVPESAIAGIPRV